MKKMLLSEATLVPVSLVLTICTGIYMFARVSMATEVQRRDIDALSVSIKEMQVDVMVTLRDQSSSLNELRTQTILLDEKLSSISERVKKL